MSNNAFTMLNRQQAQAAWIPARLHAPVSMTRSFRHSSSKPPRVPQRPHRQPDEAAGQSVAARDQLMAPALLASSGAKRSTALQFTLDSAGVGTLERSEFDDLSDEDEPSLAEELQRAQAVRTLSDGEHQLLAALEAAKAASVRSSGAVDMRLVAAELRSRWGYLVKIRHALGAKTAKGYLRHLRHSFLVVRGSELEGADVIVDVQFRDQFLLPLHDAVYERLLGELPADWVGPTSALEGVVAVMAAAMHGAFRRARVPLPPWREVRALLSKWEPQWYEDEGVALMPLPERNAPLAEMLAPYQRRGTASKAASTRRATTDGSATGAGYAAAGSQASNGTSSNGLCSSGVATRAMPAPAMARQRSAPVARSGPMQPDVPRRIVRGFASSEQLWHPEEEVAAGAAMEGVAVLQALPALQFFPQQNLQQQQQHRQHGMQPATAVNPATHQAPPAMHLAADDAAATAIASTTLPAAAEPVTPAQPAAAPANATSAAPAMSASATSAATSPWQALLRVQLPIAKPSTQTGLKAAAFKTLDQLLPPVRTVKLGAAV